MVSSQMMSSQPKPEATAMSDQATLFGIIPPLLTPTDQRENVDEPVLRRFVDALIAAGVNGLFVGGSAGEGPLLVEREWIRLAEIVFDQARGRLPLLMGVQDCSTRKVLDKIRRARDIGYRFCVVTPTYYVPCRTVGEQMRLFAACHEAAAPMELVAYNIPQLTASTVEVDTFCELARRGWIRYCKESSGDLDFVRALIARGSDVGLQVLMGDERNAAAGLRAGARGLVNLCINIEPATYLALFAAVKKGQSDEADRWQARINQVVDQVALATPCFIAGPKYVLARRGFGLGRPLSPGEPVGPEAARKLDAFLAAG
jgi:4-hydroxy-tetrahydrodipicolinate synthase